MLQNKDRILSMTCEECDIHIKESSHRVITRELLLYTGYYEDFVCDSSIHW